MKVISEAQRWLGTPYHHQGMTLGVGVDCGMLLIAVYHACGLIPLIDPRPYPPDWHLHQGDERYMGWVQQYSEQVDNPQPGDIALYRFGKCVSHGGIVVDWPMIIHAYRDQGVVLGNGTQGQLGPRLIGWWRIKRGAA